MRITKTIKMASVREPQNHWINRRVYADESGKEYIKINGNLVSIEWMIVHNWEVDIAW